MLWIKNDEKINGHTMEDTRKNKISINRRTIPRSRRGNKQVKFEEILNK